MVSLGMIFKRYKYFFLLASLFLLGGASQSSAAVIDTSTLAWVCMIGQTKCCVNGEKSCCEDDGTIYETLSCSDACGLSGTKQYKYTADSSCGYSTSTRTCCSSGSWSEWDAACPAESKTCSQSSKPDTKTTCYGGYKKRTVTCDTSTGTWTTGSWGDCDCSDDEFESVTIPDGGKCCQRIDGTGVRCSAAGVVGYQWVAAGTPCWEKSECGTSELPECNASRSGAYWSKWIYETGSIHSCSSSNDGYCQQYLCGQG